MSTSQPDASRQSEDRATPDSLLHTRTGNEVSPEDLVLASGKDLSEEDGDHDHGGGVDHAAGLGEAHAHGPPVVAG
ncbi:hypothetical protein, partial [Streptomyces albogriseolus]|uniref:hypothetical protein n=1 Tax=Streptomyces albogriseolus TaxID=1887 RepID=UPI0034616442